MIIRFFSALAQKNLRLFGGKENNNQLHEPDKTKTFLYYYKKWEEKHDRWARDLIAPTLNKKWKSYSEMKSEFKDMLLEDWRVGFAFLLERTTYQSRADKVNEYTATYLFSKVVNLPRKYSDKSVKKLIDDITEEKASGHCTHVREKKDIQRMASIYNIFLIKADEKNITKYILSIKEGENRYNFLKNFTEIGDKTASFYLKFLDDIFEIQSGSITIDRHVYNMLKIHGYLNSDKPRNAKKIIEEISRETGLRPNVIESALFEEGKFLSEKPNTRC